jgi:hypothetical protein
MSTSVSSPLVDRLQRLRHTFTELITELQFTAQHAEHIAAKRRPKLEGTPQLVSRRAHLARLVDQIDAELHRDRGEFAEALHQLLTAGGESPPVPTAGAAYAFEAVSRVARAVRSIGWNDGPGVLRDFRDPWHRQTPAQRLSKPERWRTVDGVPLPHFGTTGVPALFNAAIRLREEPAFSVRGCAGGRAERVQAEGGTQPREGGQAAGW